MKLKNLTNSPYPVPAKDGSQVIIPAFGSEEVDLDENFPIDPAFWEVEEAKPETKSAKVFVKEEVKTSSKNKNRNNRR